jgi:hypothetical protein
LNLKLVKSDANESGKYPPFPKRAEAFSKSRIVEHFESTTESLPTSAPALPVNLLNEIETRQDEVLRKLDELERQLIATLREHQLSQVAAKSGVQKAA